MYPFLKGIVQRLLTLFVVVAFLFSVRCGETEPIKCPDSMSCPPGAQWYGGGISCYASKSACERVWGLGVCSRCN